MARKLYENGGVLVWRPQGARYNTKGASVDLGIITRSEAEKLAWLWAARLVADEPSERSGALLATAM